MIGELSNWILSIAGIICLSVVVELILPDGQMNRYIKGIFSFIVVLVILLPIPKLLNKNFNISDILDGSGIEADQDYLYQLNLDKINLVKEQVEEEISKHGYQNVKVYINCDIFDNAMQFKSITVDLTSLVITENAEHKDITKRINETSSKVLVIDDFNLLLNNNCAKLFDLLYHINKQGITIIVNSELSFMDEIIMYVENLGGMVIT